MKTILILRHAKSSWDDPMLADFDRPLAKRGLKDAPRMGEVLALYDSAPDRIISSPAKRARQTAELAAKACGYKKSIRWEKTFYGAGSDDLLAALRDLPDSVARPLLIGHNPTLEDTVSVLLSAEADDDWSDSWSLRIPTAGLVCLDVNIDDWADLEPGDAILRWFVIPKLVKAIT